MGLVQIANLHQLGNPCGCPYSLQRICNPLVIFCQRITNPLEQEDEVVPERSRRGKLGLV